MASPQTKPVRKIPAKKASVKSKPASTDHLRGTELLKNTLIDACMTQSIVHTSHFLI